MEAGPRRFAHGAQDRPTPSLDGRGISGIDMPHALVLAARHRPAHVEEKRKLKFVVAKRTMATHSAYARPEQRPRKSKRSDHIPAQDPPNPGQVESEEHRRGEPNQGCKEGTCTKKPAKRYATRRTGGTESRRP